MAHKMQTLRAGYRVVLSGTTKLGHITGDYVIGFTTFEATGEQVGRSGWFSTPEEACRTLVTLASIRAQYEVVTC